MNRSRSPQNHSDESQDGVRDPGETAPPAAAVRRSWAWKLACIAWGVCLLVGYVFSVDEQARPAPAGQAPSHWPASAPVAGPSGRPVLTVFIHPYCPCSRATLAELAGILELRPGAVDARVVFSSDPRLSTPAGESPLLRQARAIPGVTVLADQGGGLARQFGATTSGYAVLYDASGRLRFFGGLTAARGHRGPNSGSDLVLARLDGTGPASGCHATFGCPLFCDSIEAPRQ